jgi:hypothetical protein
VVRHKIKILSLLLPMELKAKLTKNSPKII